MKQLELSDDAKISTTVLDKAITEAARLNYKQVDKEVLAKIIEKFGEMSRDEIRETLQQEDVAELLFNLITP